MSVTVSIPSALRRHTEGLETFECPPGNLNALLDSLSARFPELKPHLRDEQGKVRRFLNIYVNDEDIRYLQKEATALKDSDNISIVPSIAGGAA